MSHIKCHTMNKFVQHDIKQLTRDEVYLFAKKRFENSCSNV
jgi:hypothetical protein